MPWTKLSDDFTDDCWNLSDAAFRLHIEGLVWSNRKLLDLRIPKDDLARFSDCRVALPELLETGWWRATADAYEIVHHGLYQRTREAVLRQQEVNRTNGLQGGRPAGPPRERAPRVRKPNRFPTETESLSESLSAPPAKTESLSESPTERDRTGNYGSNHLRDRETDSLSNSIPAWPPVTQPGSHRL